MSQPNITIVAYRSSGVDTCRGCVMESWDSDFEMTIFNDVDQAINCVSNFYHRNTKMDRQDVYEVNILINGIGGENGETMYVDWESDEEIERREDLVRMIREGAQVRCNEMVLKEKQRKEEQEAKQRHERETAARQEELERLTRKLSPEQLEKDQKRLQELQGG